MAGCLVVILVFLFSPRFAGLIFWIFTNWFDKAYQTWYWPLLGWIFLPFTTLAYMWAYLSTGGDITGGWIALIVFAVLVDLGSNAASKKKSE